MATTSDPLYEWMSALAFGAAGVIAYEFVFQIYGYANVPSNEADLGAFFRGPPAAAFGALTAIVGPRIHAGGIPPQRRSRQ